MNLVNNKAENARGNFEVIKVLIVAFQVSVLPSKAPSPLRSAGALQRRLMLVIALVFGASILPLSSLAQDARELEQERTASKKLKGEHPLLALMRTRKSVLRAELLGVHPRVYVTDKELDNLRERSRTSHRELWQRTISHVRALGADPP